jgi:NAD(P)-dependent dehydrogenase (short-subunit alcohol dehydrogenase family)
MDLGLVGKVAWVTGGGRGIGAAIATGLAAEGADVAITGRTLSTLEDTAASIAGASGRRVIAVPADVMDTDAVNQAAATISEELGRLDILVNAAATPLRQGDGTLESASAEHMVQELDEKVGGDLRTSQAAAPYMKQRGWGRLIHVGGLLARQANSYAPRNLAIVHLSKTLSDELGQYGITSNVVHPGATRGPRLAQSIASQSAARGVTEGELEAEFASGYAIRRLLDPEEIAHVVAFLASPLSGAITGESIGTGGGMTGMVTI